jgi:effector-binding domain-containing protein
MDSGHVITIVEVQPALVAGMRRKGSYTLIPVMIMDLFGFLCGKGIPPAGGPVYLFHEGSPEAAFAADAAGTADIEIVVPVTGKFPPAGDISCYRLPGGKMARVIRPEGPLPPWTGGAASRLSSTVAPTRNAPPPMNGSLHG